MQPSRDKTNVGASQLHQQVQQALRGNLLRALAVSDHEEETPAAMSQEELAARTGIARSTIIKFLSREGVNRANPDMRTLCRLAEVLNVPPAFLLMTKEDWTRLGSALHGLSLYLQDEPARAIVGRGTKFRTPRENARIGLNLASRFGLRTRKASADNAVPQLQELQELHQRQLQGIKAAAAMPPWSEIRCDPEILFVTCTQMGAATHI